MAAAAAARAAERGGAVVGRVAPRGDGRCRERGGGGDAGRGEGGGEGCNPMYPKLQPYASQAATLCTPGCNPMYPRLQPHVQVCAEVGAKHGKTAYQVALRWIT